MIVLHVFMKRKQRISLLPAETIAACLPRKDLLAIVIDPFALVVAQNASFFWTNIQQIVLKSHNQLLGVLVTAAVEKILAGGAELIG